MTVCYCPAGHAVLVLEGTNFGEWRCPVHGYMDKYEAKKRLEDFCGICGYRPPAVPRISRSEVLRTHRCMTGHEPDKTALEKQDPTRPEPDGGSVQGRGEAAEARTGSPEEAGGKCPND